MYAYLDDILILGDSPHEVQQFVQKVLQMLTRAGFIVNLKKSDLAPTQDLVYIGARFRMDLGRLYLSEEWIDRLLALVKSSRVEVYKPALLFLSLLGLMADILQSVEYTHLRIRPMWYLKRHWNHVTHRLCYPILVTEDLTKALQWWPVRGHLSQGMPLTLPSTTITFTMDARVEGWGGHC